MSRSQITGGKLYAEGTYGCIFIPPLVCKDEEIRSVDKRIIDKLIDKENAEVEMKISERVQRIPLWKNYFVVPFSMCEPAPRTMQTNVNVAKCDVIQQKRLDRFRLLQMNYGGKPLKTAIIDMKTQSLFDIALHLIEAGALLNLFGIVHSDIHQGNILIDNENIPRIIDFNLSVDVRNPDLFIYLNHPVMVSLFQEPPDACIVNGISKNIDGYKIITDLINTRKTFKKLQALFGLSVYDLRYEMEEFIKNSKIAQAGDVPKWFSTYWSKIDTWAIGMNIVCLLTDNLMWESFAIGQYKEYKEKLLPVLHDMTQVNPMKRIDCVQALARLDTNNFIIRKYGQEWLQKVKAKEQVSVSGGGLVFSN
jgi:serine/threonine protein kinase